MTPLISLTVGSFLCENDCISTLVGNEVLEQVGNGIVGSFGFQFNSFALSLGVSFLAPWRDGKGNDIHGSLGTRHVVMLWLKDLSLHR